MVYRPWVVSLFSGAGGLDIGLKAAGCETIVGVECDPIAVDTLEHNVTWPVIADDIHNVDPKLLLSVAGVKKGDVDILAGGPPCQPFSKSGYWKNGDSARLQDPRSSTLKAYIKVLRALLPSVILLENVSGLVYRDKDEGIRYIEREIKKINRENGTNYYPEIFRVNAADYGVPQLRERVFVVAHRDGLSLDLPPATHAPAEVATELNLSPYLTAWDAIGDLDFDIWPKQLDASGKYAQLLPSIPEGENYLWHTNRGGGEPLFGWRTRYWSFLLKLAKHKPSWTIQATPGSATGPFHWRSRKLSVREMCRLQTIPDNYEILGVYASAQKQIGNAVPSAIGELFGKAIRRSFFSQQPHYRLKLIPERMPSIPSAQRRRPVPKKYLSMRKRHKPHPGTGKGPGALQINAG